MPVLPQDTVEAVDTLIKIVEELTVLTEKELSAHLIKDGVAMVAVQTDKEAVATRYEEAAKEFIERIGEFRTVEKTKLDQLDTMQRKLSDKAKENMKAIKVPVSEEADVKVT